MKLSRLGLYYHTARFLRPIQIFNRLQRRCSQTAQTNNPVPPRRKPHKDHIHFINKQSSIFKDNQFRFLNDERAVPTQASWNDKAAPKLWLYNLHYHDGLNSEKTTDRLLKIR